MDCVDDGVLEAGARKCTRRTVTVGGRLPATSPSTTTQARTSSIALSPALPTDAIQFIRHANKPVLGLALPAKLQHLGAWGQGGKAT